MNELDSMISGWKNQSIPEAGNNAKTIAEMAKKRITDSRNKHVATIAVLGVTLFVLIFFALSAGGKGSLFLTGISLMIGALAVRIGVEYWSSIQLKKLNIGDKPGSYLTQLVRFYQIRKRIHGSFTIVSFGLYMLGFVLLLPLFRQSLSNGFFIYIIVSGLVIFAALIYFIGKKVNEELGNLSLTIRELSTLAESFNK